MNTIDNSPVNDPESSGSMSVEELQHQLNESIKQLSPKRLKVVVYET
jgi:hypothetical protein